MLDAILSWISANQEAIAFSFSGAILALTAWTCGLITRTVIETIAKEDCDC
ncbi:hypothetical protein [Streptomyces melanogenes]|uniref:hypothetical protein n=1 Tax=Streptomyces melanogenes TaxID=67326 RepID=UPI00167DAAE7|nr:hypothetical protein [Streptomyces melanogenes]GGP72229.1 hypothetical protein GCM10010278_57900 [Streptomyces melanogenes]